MIAKIDKMTVVEVVLREGKGKTSGKDYSFYNVKVADESFNVFNLTLSDKMASSPSVVKQLLEMKGVVDCELEIEFKPKGFDIQASVLAIETP